MKKNIAAFLTHILIKDKGMAPALVKELIFTTCGPMFVNEIDDCTWDPATKSISTPRDAQIEAENAHEKSEFYIDIDKLLISGKGKKDSGRQNQRKATAEQLRRFKDAASFNTLNVKDDDDAGRKGYSGDLGAPTLSLGKTKASPVAVADIVAPPALTSNSTRNNNNGDGTKDDGVSALSGTSGASSSRKEVAKLEQQLAEARAMIEAMKALKEPSSTARLKGSGSSLGESLSNTSSSSSDDTDESSSPATSFAGSQRSGPSLDSDL